jgi:ATP-dependent Clp protease adaptor protein ClpS
MSTDNDTVVMTTTALKRPTNWAIVLHNDDVTPMDFVVELLLHTFKMDYQQAAALMLTVHSLGKGVAGIFSYEIAEQKMAEAQTHIKLSKQQLKLTLEEE